MFIPGNVATDQTSTLMALHTGMPAKQVWENPLEISWKNNRLTGILQCISTGNFKCLLQ